MFTEKAKENLKAMLWQAKISAVDNTDAQAMRVPSLYADWEALESGTHLTKGQRVNYKGMLYNVLTDHDKQAQWTPEAAPSQAQRKDMDKHDRQQRMGTGSDGDRRTVERSDRVNRS